MVCDYCGQVVQLLFHGLDRLVGLAVGRCCVGWLVVMLGLVWGRGVGDNSLGPVLWGGRGGVSGLWHHCCWCLGLGWVCWLGVGLHWR